MKHNKLGNSLKQSDQRPKALWNPSHRAKRPNSNPGDIHTVLPGAFKLSRWARRAMSQGPWTLGMFGSQLGWRTSRRTVLGVKARLEREGLAKPL